MEKIYSPFLTVKTKKEISLLEKILPKRVWKYLEDPLLKPIELLLTILGVGLVFYGFLESHRVTWLTSISANSQELAKMEIEHDYLSCLYPSETSVKMEQSQNINYCNNLYRHSINIKKATLYLEANLDFIEDIIKYDKKYHEQEFIKYYQEWYYNLHKNNITEEFRTKYIQSKIDNIDYFIQNNGAKWRDYIGLSEQKKKQLQ